MGSNNQPPAARTFAPPSPFGQSSANILSQSQAPAQVPHSNFLSIEGLTAAQNAPNNAFYGGASFGGGPRGGGGGGQEEPMRQARSNLRIHDLWGDGGVDMNVGNRSNSGQFV